MTERSYDLRRLGEIRPVQRRLYDGPAPYRPYGATDAGVPPFLPLGNDRHQVRMTASTHDQDGILQHSTPEALDNTRRLPAKVKARTPPLYHLEEAQGLDEAGQADALIVTYGISSGAAREAVQTLNAQGMAVSLLVARTLVPVPEAYYQILDRYRSANTPVIFVEENLQGQFASILFGERHPEGVRVVGDIGHMIKPDDIVREVCR